VISTQSTSIAKRKSFNKKIRFWDIFLSSAAGGVAYGGYRVWVNSRRTEIKALGGIIISIAPGILCHD
jgi:hypothetical protein